MAQRIMFVAPTMEQAKKNQERFGNPEGSLAVGVSSAIAGFGADYILIDDTGWETFLLHLSPERQFEVKELREEWEANVLLPRKNPGCQVWRRES